MIDHDRPDDDERSDSMHHDILKPTEEWKWPSDSELASFTRQYLKLNPTTNEAEGFCECSSLGLYTFMRYCREQGTRSKILAEFIEDVATFRGGVSDRISVHLAKKIDSDYLKDGSTGRTVLVSSRRATNLLRRIVHPEEDFSDYTYPPNSPNSSRTLTTSSEFDSLCSPTESIESFSFGTSRSFQSEWTGYFSVSNAKNAIKVTGDPVDRVTDILQTLGLKSEIGLSCATSVHTRIFDELDEIVFGYLKDIYWDAFRKSFWWTRHHEFLFLSARKVVSTDFFTLRVLGKGGFGMVNACKRCTTGKHYAMKRLHKKGIKLKKAAAHCLQERSNLATIHSPFVVRLRFAFTTPTDLYLILDLMTGGDLGFHLSRKGRFSDREARYYAARTLLGIAAMHEKGIAHRDLKPENILMDEDGYTKISDLGLACKVSKSGLSGTCGTRGYWAPEMLRRNAQSKKEHYTLTVDWFSFGCCLYEFLYGVSPFRTEKARNWGDFMKTEKADRDRAIDLAVQYMEPEFDDHIFNAAAKDLISKLLNKDGKRRLGANGFKEIAAHPWFKTVDWANLECSKPPSAPSSKDMAFLCESKLGLFPSEKESRKVLLTEADHSLFQDWEYISQSSFEEEIVELLVCEEISGPIHHSTRRKACCTLS